MAETARPEQPSDTRGARPPLVASPPSRRLGGAVVDGLVFLVPGTVALLADGLPRLAQAALVIVPWAAYQIVAVAVWGRTLGKAAVGTRVVLEEGRGSVGWRVAAIRWGVPAAATFGISLIPGAGSLLSLLWSIVIYSGILRDAQRRGLHDQIAGTVVVHDPL